MRRSAAVLESRLEALRRIKAHWEYHFSSADIALKDSELFEASLRYRNAWRKRYRRVEGRVWYALCVTKGWRKA